MLEIRGSIPIGTDASPAILPRLASDLRLMAKTEVRTTDGAVAFVVSSKRWWRSDLPMEGVDKGLLRIDGEGRMLTYCLSISRMTCECLAMSIAFAVIAGVLKESPTSAILYGGAAFAWFWGLNRWLVGRRVTRYLNNVAAGSPMHRA